MMAVTKDALPLQTSNQGGPIIVRGDYAATLPYLPMEWMLDFKFMPIKFTKHFSNSEFFLHMTVGGENMVNMSQVSITVVDITGRMSFSLSLLQTTEKL